jgi:CHASE3 domain sensor protein
MKRLAVRLTLVGLFVIAVGASAYLFWMGETRARSEAQSARTFDQRAVAATRGVLDLRAAQQAYVATGQGDQFWANKVTTALASLKESLNALRAAASSPQAQSDVDGAVASLQDFEQMDRRARDYAQSGQKLLASDLIFADGFETTTGAVTAIDRARDAEGQAQDDSAQGIRRRQLYALGGAAAAAFLAVLLLAPRSAAPAAPVFVQEPLRVPDHNEGLDLGAALDEGWPGPKKTATPEQARTAPPAPAAADAALDIAGVAALCTELARVVDTRALPAILERAAHVLDASGIVLWISDPDARELSPIITHGYSPHLVSRLGTILRDAENATAAAFRTSLVQTVKTDAVSQGAIAAPLVTPAGCVGVMAAEVRHSGEQDRSKLAAAAIVAAQLATLVGPPSASVRKAEAI